MKGGQFAHVIPNSCHDCAPVKSKDYGPRDAVDNIEKWKLSSGYTIYGTQLERIHSLRLVLAAECIRPVVQISIIGISESKCSILDFVRKKPHPDFEQNIDITRFFDMYGEFTHIEKRKEKTSGLENILQQFVGEDKTVRVLRIEKQISKFHELQSYLVKSIKTYIKREFSWDKRILVRLVVSQGKSVSICRSNAKTAYDRVKTASIHGSRSGRRKILCRFNHAPPDEIFQAIKSEIHSSSRYEPWF